MMWRVVSFILVLSYSVLEIKCFDNKMIGPGRWFVHNINQCDNPDQYEFKFDISRRKLNRTHDCFAGDWDFPRTFGFNFGIKIDVYKEADGGFKYFNTYDDDCMCTFVMQYAGENMVKAFTAAGIDPPDCPVSPNKYVIDNFMVDYSQLHESNIYGNYEAYAYVLYDNEKVACLKIIVSFDEQNEDDDEDE